MRTTAAARTDSRRPRGTRLRDLWHNQTRLWDGALDDLQPWRAEGPLRWHGDRLEGAALTEGSPQPTR